MIDLYSGEKRKIPLLHACRFALLTDERMYLADTRKVTILEYKP